MTYDHSRALQEAYDCGRTDFVAWTFDEYDYANADPRLQLNEVARGFECFSARFSDRELSAMTDAQYEELRAAHARGWSDLKEGKAA